MLLSMLYGDAVMEALVLGAGIACVIFSRVAVHAGAPAAASAAGGMAWGPRLGTELRLLQPWLALSPLCWAAAFGVIDDPALHDLGVALGLLPILGGLAAFGTGLMRTSMAIAAESDDDDTMPFAPLALALGAALSVGVALGMTWRVGAQLLG